jgi:hypothetical protein
MGTFLRRLATLTGRLAGLQWLSGLMSGRYSTASAVFCLSTTSSLWTSVRGKYLVSFGQSRLNWEYTASPMGVVMSTLGRRATQLTPG